MELPNGSYADTLARQFLFDVWHYFLLEGLCQSSDARIAEIAQKCFKEVTYHVRRSTDLMIRLGDGTEDSHRRMQAAIDALWMYTGELFVADALDQAMQEQGVATALGEVQQKWTQHVTDVLLEATLKVPPAGLWMQSGGKAGRHTEHLGYLLAEMQFLQRAYPGAQW